MTIFPGRIGRMENLLKINNDATTMYKNNSRDSALHRFVHLIITAKPFALASNKT
jgi:hypothetical protein